jgi:hypothetical protein
LIIVHGGTEPTIKAEGIQFDKCDAKIVDFY